MATANPTRAHDADLMSFAPPADHWRSQLQALRDLSPDVAAALEAHWPKDIEHLPAMGLAAVEIAAAIKMATP